MRGYLLTRKEIGLGKNIWVTSGYIDVFLTLDDVHNVIHNIVLFIPCAYFKYFFHISIQ